MYSIGEVSVFKITASNTAKITNGIPSWRGKSSINLLRDKQTHMFQENVGNMNKTYIPRTIISEPKNNPPIDTDSQIAIMLLLIIFTVCCSCFLLSYPSRWSSETTAILSRKRRRNIREHSPRISKDCKKEWSMGYKINSTSSSEREKAKILKRKTKTGLNECVVTTSQQKWVHLSDSFLQALFTDREM